MLLSNGTHPYNPNVTVVPKEVLDFVTHGRSIISGVPLYPDTSPMVYGAAQYRYSYRGLDLLEHGGNNPGFKSQVARFPQKYAFYFLLSYFVALLKEKTGTLA